jgi:hypothetical protein
LFRYQIVWTAQEDLRRQVAALLSAKRAGDHDGLEWKLVHPTGYIPATSLALDNEDPAILNSERHRRTSIGEYMAKVYRLPVSFRGSRNGGNGVTNLRMGMKLLECSATVQVGK